MIDEHIPSPEVDAWTPIDFDKLRDELPRAEFEVPGNFTYYQDKDRHRQSILIFTPHASLPGKSSSEQIWKESFVNF